MNPLSPTTSGKLEVDDNAFFSSLIAELRSSKFAHEKQMEAVCADLQLIRESASSVESGLDKDLQPIADISDAVSRERVVEIVTTACSMASFRIGGVASLVIDVLGHVQRFKVLEDRTPIASLLRGWLSKKYGKWGRIILAWFKSLEHVRLFFSIIFFNNKQTTQRWLAPI